LLWGCFFTFFCGIYRHDKEREKYITLGGEPQFHSVGSVNINGIHKGSCVLISQNYVLSAAHLFRTRSKVGTKNEIIYTIDTNQLCKITLNGKEYQSARIVIYPDYFDGYLSNDGDIVLIKLNGSITDIIPTHLNDEPTELHKVITIVGYGPARPANEPTESVPYGKIAGQNILDSICGKKVNGIQSKIGFDFDSPMDSSTNVMGSNIACPLEYIPTGGDSGGGLFIENNGGWQLIGIISHGINTYSLNGGWYGSYVFATHVAAYKRWIDRNIED
jgi:secreted trypsin-like serine protease